MKVEALKELIIKKQQNVSFILSSCNNQVISDQYTVNTFVESNVIKFAIQNKHGHKTVLYASSLPGLIDNLKTLQNMLLGGDANGKKKG